MDDFKTQLEELAGQVDNITVVKKVESIIQITWISGLTDIHNCGRNRK